MGDKKIKDFQPPYEEGREGLGADEVLTGAERPGTPRRNAGSSPPDTS